MPINLPIDLVPNTRPQRFRWKQVVQSPIGTRVVEYESELPPNVESAVVELIALVKSSHDECEQVRAINFGLAERVAAQSELLSKRAEKDETIDTGAGVVPGKVSIKKIKGS